MQGPRLARRQIDILTLYARGYSVRKTAGLAGVSLTTVREYLRDVREIFGVKTSQEAARLAMAAGMIFP